MKSYVQRHPLSDDYRQRRRWVYQLYPLLDHISLFGDKYVNPMLGVLEKINRC